MKAIIELQNIKKAFESNQIDYKTKVKLENKVHEKAEVQNSFKSHKHIYKTMFPKRIHLQPKKVVSQQEQLNVIANLDLSKKKTKNKVKKEKKTTKIQIDAALIPDSLKGLLNAIN
jgi:hypothetical protein